MCDTICGADCSACSLREGCAGCRATCGRPFGGPCVAAEYIRAGGQEAYAQFRRTLLSEINSILRDRGIPEADALYALPGSMVNLAYPMPSGEAVKLLDERKIYLGCQIAFADLGVCYGVAADTTFILVCSYSVDGSQPELIAFHRR